MTRLAAIAAACLMLGATAPLAAQSSTSAAIGAFGTVDGAPPARGRVDARVTIVEFADFTSEPSARLAFMLDALAALYPRDVRVVFRHAPDGSRPNATQAHAAALAAAAQGRFWEMADVIFANQDRADRADFVAMAAQLGLDTARFAADLDGSPLEAIVDRDRRAAAEAGVRASASCMLNGVVASWPVTLSQLRRAVETALASAR